MLKFMFLGPLLVSPVIGVSGLAATDAAAQQAKRVPLKLHESEISFIRADSFIAGRFTWEPLPKNQIWRETLTFAGGAMTFYELLPNYFY